MCWFQDAHFQISEIRRHLPVHDTSLVSAWSEGRCFGRGPSSFCQPSGATQPQTVRHYIFCLLFFWITLCKCRGQTCMWLLSSGEDFSPPPSDKVETQFPCIPFLHGGFVFSLTASLRRVLRVLQLYVGGFLLDSPHLGLYFFILSGPHNSDASYNHGFAYLMKKLLLQILYMIFEIVQHANRKGDRILKKWFHEIKLSCPVLNHFLSVSLTGHSPFSTWDC